MKLNTAAEVLGAISQANRLKVFRLLVKQGEEGMCAGDIARRLKIAKPTLSFHLKELVRVKLIRAERDGRSIIYRLNISRMRGLMEFLSQDCCQGRPELCGANSHAAKQNTSCC